MTIRRNKPNAPPPGYDQRWMYWLWEYVNQGIGTGDLTGTFGTFAGFNSFRAAGDALGTTTTSTLTMALSTTGVTAGTYGGTNSIPRFDIDAKGRVLSGTSIPVVAGVSVAVGAVTGTSTTGTLTAAFTPNPAFTGTGTAAGWRVLQGSSTVYGKVPVQGGFIPGSTRSTQASFTYAAGTAPLNAMLGTGNGLSLSAWGTFVFRPNRFAVTFGSGTLAVSTATHAAVNWEVDASVYSLSDTTQAYRVRFDLGGATTDFIRELWVGTLALATGSALVMSVIGTQSTNVQTNVCFGGIVDFRNGP